VSLLRNPDAKVINVAQECGFNHLGLFNTCFKRRFGCSPGQWRKLATEGSPRGNSGNSGHDQDCPLGRVGLCPLKGHPAEAGSAVSASIAGTLSNTLFKIGDLLPPPNLGGDGGPLTKKPGKHAQ
jgi:hypothetical protein